MPVCGMLPPVGAMQAPSDNRADAITSAATMVFMPFLLWPDRTAVWRKDAASLAPIPAIAHFSLVE
jgi:hypothetical protein